MWAGNQEVTPTAAGKAGRALIAKKVGKEHKGSRANILQFLSPRPKGKRNQECSTQRTKARRKCSPRNKREFPTRASCSTVCQEQNFSSRKGALKKNDKIGGEEKKTPNPRKQRGAKLPHNRSEHSLVLVKSGARHHTFGPEMATIKFQFPKIRFSFPLIMQKTL